ncbi:MAG: flagellin [Thermodesulfobacteriota bacterium]|nr:flagellin [Thermodesulfobacteriota bacterium]
MAITLTSGMRQNLFALQGTAKLMEQTQNRLSTGKRVNSALDDPINFFSAQNHQQRADDLSFRKDAMGEAIQTAKAGNNGIEAITDLIAQAKSTAQSAASSAITADRLALSVQYTELQAQIDFMAADSGYKGVNFLNSENLTVSFDADGASTLTLTGFDGSATGLGLAVVSDWAADATNTATDIALLDTAKDTLRTEAQELSNNLSIVTTRQDFTEKMVNTLEDGVANLTNADMNEEGANMLMLQTRQALGTTSLSLASEAAQSVLRLF